MPLYLVLILSLFLAACGNTQLPPQQSVFPLMDGELDGEQRYLHSALFEQYQDWYGTRYKLGGLSNNGIDCSGFVHLTYLDKFGLALPRTTAQQVKRGDFVERSDLKMGDLVFFKTGYKVRHVGIYLARDQFLHASTSEGVKISNLENSYWNKAYWQSRRVALP